MTGRIGDPVTDSVDRSERSMKDQGETRRYEQRQVPVEPYYIVRSRLSLPPDSLKDQKSTVEVASKEGKSMPGSPHACNHSTGFALNDLFTESTSEVVATTDCTDAHDRPLMKPEASSAISGTIRAGQNKVNWAYAIMSEAWTSVMSYRDPSREEETLRVGTHGFQNASGASLHVHG